MEILLGNQPTKHNMRLVVLLFLMAAAAAMAMLQRPNSVHEAYEHAQRERALAEQRQHERWSNLDESSSGGDGGGSEQQRVRAARSEYKQGQLAASAGGFSVPSTHRKVWQRLRDAVTPEALEYAADIDSSEHYSDDEQEFALLTGRYDDDEPAAVFGFLQHCLEEQRFALAISQTLTPDARYVDHSNERRSACEGASAVVACMRQEHEARVARCAQLHCDSATYSTEIMPTGGPTALVRMVETLSVNGAPLQQQLSLYLMILRPPFDNATRSTAHSRIAVLERLSAPLRSDYEPPTELALQAAHLQRYAVDHERHWSALHERSVNDHRERLERAQRYGASDVQRWARDANEWCQRRALEGDARTHAINCQHARDLLAKHDNSPTVAAKLRARSLVPPQPTATATSRARRYVLHKNRS